MFDFGTITMIKTTEELETTVLDAYKAYKLQQYPDKAEEIAKTKMPDLTAADLNAAVRTIAGSARSMGIEVEGI